MSYIWRKLKPNYFYSYVFLLRGTIFFLRASANNMSDSYINSMEVNRINIKNVLASRRHQTPEIWHTKKQLQRWELSLCQNPMTYITYSHSKRHETPLRESTHRYILLLCTLAGIQAHENWGQNEKWKLFHPNQNLPPRSQGEEDLKTADGNQILGWDGSSSYWVNVSNWEFGVFERAGAALWIKGIYTSKFRQILPEGAGEFHFLSLLRAASTS